MIAPAKMAKFIRVIGRQHVSITKALVEHCGHGPRFVEAPAKSERFLLPEQMCVSRQIKNKIDERKVGGGDHLQVSMSFSIYECML
jgi:hypothetical protein